jgi:hypothetical protein
VNLIFDWRSVRSQLLAIAQSINQEIRHHLHVKGNEEWSIQRRGIVGILKRHEAGQKVADLGWEVGVSEATIYTSKRRAGG